MTEHQARVEQALADYRRSRERLIAAQRELASVRASASSADGSVTATVGLRSALTGLTIDDRAYQRYRPAELAAEIVRLTAEAGAEAFASAGEVLAPALDSGTDPQALLLGTGDLTAEELAPAEPDTDGPVAPTDGPDGPDFDDRDWLHGDGARDGCDGR
ncbi:YbaB/EbfC family nucleoid-associated protein [Saccharomonospora iraqiensis]|uniref:YbaB/EbfC family nucleoid-associated protein n=1 Tax=Saccharomonospora iraqiensis TaxID=52698 RepID=UPI00022E0088|nr:YbaB/EbfC family nucleoid-associated protein [Saccharomonospora iraqiensis]